MAGIHNELEPEVKISLTESWIVASHRPAEHTRVSNEHKLSRHLRVESVEAHKAGITLFAADCWSTAAHHCAWPTASSGWWPPPLLPLPLAILSLLLQPLRRLLRCDHPSPASSRDVLHAGVKRDPTKFSNSRNAGPHSTFSRGHAAFRCVSNIEGERPGP